MYQKKKEIEKILILLLDIVCIVASFFAGCFIRFGRLRNTGIDDEMQLSLFLILLIYMGLSLVMDMYHHFFQRGYLEEFREVIKAEVSTFIITVTVLYLLHRASAPSRLAALHFGKRLHHRAGLGPQRLALGRQRDVVAHVLEQRPAQLRLQRRYVLAQRLPGHIQRLRRAAVVHLVTHRQKGGQLQNGHGLPPLQTQAALAF